MHVCGRCPESLMSDRRKQFLDRATALIDRSQGRGLAVPVDTGFFSVDPEDIERLSSLLGEAADLLREIESYYETEAEAETAEAEAVADDADFLRQIGASISTELASREVADLAFMGRGELRELRRKLAGAVEQKQLWKIAAHADAATTRTSRCLIPIESAIRQYEGLPPKKRRWEDLDDSLEIRRQYVDLWRNVVRDGVPEGARLRAELGRVAEHIAELRGRPIYPFLRIEDRLEIRRLQKRILAYLQGEDSPEREDGQRLWSDLAGFFRLLMQINNRQELREHDRKVVLRSRRVLDQARGQGVIPRQVLSDLDCLLGRDEELDRVLLDPEEHRPEDCMAPLERLQQRLASSADDGF